MARLDEHQGKQLLAQVGLAVPEGGRAATPDEAHAIGQWLERPCVVKALAAVTGRAARGWIRLADTPDDVALHAAELLAEPGVKAVRVEERLRIEQELLAGILVDDSKGKPLALLCGRGGSGIEEMAREHPDSVARRHIDVRQGLQPYMGREMAREAGLSGKLQVEVGSLLSLLYTAFRQFDCRSIEVNPVVWTTEGGLVSADCHAAIDDYAVYRHPDLGIRIAREIGHEPSDRELLAYEVEKNDHRGTFYFIQLEDATSGKDFVAFHGAGGGGSMMSMDALMEEGFRAANFCDTSGNPPASKVYRAAKILLTQPGIVGYFASGSGVASQEQWQSAHGFIKAFRELGLRVPAVIRLGGNEEDVAIERLQRFCANLEAPVEAYGKDDSARFCARRLRALVDQYTPPTGVRRPNPLHEVQLSPDVYRFATLTGSISIDQGGWSLQTAESVAASCPRGILKVTEYGDRIHLILAIEEEAARRGRCTECLACELKADELGCRAINVDLPLPVLNGRSAEAILGLVYEDKGVSGNTQ